MSSTSATPPATRRIARSYLTDLVAAVPWPDEAVIPYSVMPVVDQLLDRAIQVRHVLRSDQLVLTFDLADDPASWATQAPRSSGLPGATEPAVAVGRDEAAGEVQNREYPGQPGERG